MFTGIVREIGTVAEISGGDEGARLRIETRFAGELDEGDSVCVEGVCLTAAEVSAGEFTADVMNQTLGLTTLGGLEAGSRVNLEPALRAGEPLGGHLVQGHVDGVGEVRSVAEDGFARRIGVAAPAELARYLVERGSVTVAGVSLTVAGLGEDGGFEVSLIPETLERTTLGDLEEGTPVNLEVDVLARYVERLLRFQPEGSS
jgi:riboflavin synthase